MALRWPLALRGRKPREANVCDACNICRALHMHRVGIQFRRSAPFFIGATKRGRRLMLGFLLFPANSANTNEESKADAE
jgi:hypothetical protein